MTPHQLRRRRLLAHMVVAAALVSCALLWLYPPSAGKLYPNCPIHALFGIDCPGCGATRALAALLRGHLCEALRLNALFVLLLPAALAVAIETYRRAVRPGAFTWPTVSASTLYAIATACVIFTVARNVLP